MAASIGAARFPEDGGDANALLRCADVAMYAAKDAQAEYKLYAVEQNRHSVRRLSVLSDFRRGLGATGTRRPLPADHGIGGPVNPRRRGARALAAS